MVEEKGNESRVMVGFEARQKICCAFCTGFIFSSAVSEFELVSLRKAYFYCIWPFSINVLPTPFPSVEVV
jgi:hypothetical protein